MKKLFFCLFLVLVGLSINTVKAQIGVNDLKNDESLSGFIEKYFANVVLLNESYIGQELSTLRNELVSLNGNSDDAGVKLEGIRIKLKFSNKEELVESYNNVLISYDVLQKKYGKNLELIPKDILKNAIVEILNDPKNQTNLNKLAPAGCGFVCVLCIAGAVVEGATMLQGCLEIAGASAGTATPAAIACALLTAAWTANAVFDCKN
jgi:hypothetical protein